MRKKTAPAAVAVGVEPITAQTASKVPDKAAPRKIPKAAPKALFKHTDSVPPIVGIGASAGGLEALDNFLAHVPAGSGMAFVIVQHLDPTHKGIMPELLQRATPMTVEQAGRQRRVYFSAPVSGFSTHAARRTGFFYQRE